MQLPLAEQAELQALRQLSTDALRTIAAEQMAAIVQARMAQLLERNSFGKLSLAEQQELATLIERGDQLMLRKAEAVKILAQRGFDEKPHRESRWSKPPG